eukprot:CAMPEP_0201699742 /NCGR_PEP_ID=MMETSP0578-20130828/25266_1 /ASSEMBLY_ACC=CAM_ASM_000663 /TAXON_ID=267565 /ORGANISM="Skeletonema grethea, Strain CCMP 1804" /LENGTH=329 /DNA_ID=CAMNT_0048186579 /DNA_START=17 /DNA_END=1006 /DNA_ORIENTATION=+
MALAYPISNVKDLIHAFAAKDEFISALSFYLHCCNNQVDEYYIMDPTDDYYVAPYCFMPRRQQQQRRFENNNCTTTFTSGFLIFASMKPFGKKTEHEDARSLVEREGYHPIPHIDTIETFQKNLKLNEMDIYTFTHDGCVPTAKEVSQELEDTAIRVVCDLMKWKMPYNWRLRKGQVDNLFGPVLDLAEWDGRRGQQQQQHLQQRNDSQRHSNQEMQQQQEHFYDAKQRTQDNPKITTEEEKKETTTLDYLPLPPVHTPTQQKSSGGGGGGFFERNDDIFGSNQTFISRYNNTYNNRYNHLEDDDGNTFISESNMVYDENDIFGDVDGI